MKIKEISWFKEFTCLCGDCPQTCCRGWVIPLSDRDCERLRKEKGRTGIELFIATAGWTEAKFNSRSGKCFFQGKDGLCRLQKKKGHEFIPWTCQSYPRFYRNYGDFEEVCLDLSCIGAAQLFIKNKGSLEVTEREGEPQTRVCTTNDDPGLLRELIRLRTEMTDTAKDLSGRYADRLFEFAILLQDRFAKGVNAGAEGLSFTEFLKEERTDGTKGAFAFPLPAYTLLGFLDSSLYHIRLRRTDPKLYGMFTKASAFLKSFSQNGWQDAVKTFLYSEPLAASVLGAYLAYYLYQYYLRAYETYSFRRQTALGLCHVNMVLLLTMSACEGRAVTEDMLAGTIAAYNRRAYFNDAIQDEMYRIFEDSLRNIKN